MALLFCDSFDTYAVGQILAKWTSNPAGSLSLGSPGRLGYGQYLSVNNGEPALIRGLSGGPYTTLINGFAWYLNSGSVPNTDIWGFYDNLGNTLCDIRITTTGQLAFSVPGGATTYSSAGIISAKTWAYIEADVVFSASTSGSFTLRYNGVTVLTASSVNTASNGNGCSGAGPSTGTNCFYDDVYMLNSTSPNNAFFGDTKIIALMPNGNGRVNGWTRFGGSASGNYTAVNEIPPDGDTSYVYTATPTTEDCYTIQSLSNVSTVVAVQLSAYARKDDTPSRVLGLGVGNGSTESFPGSGTSLNTSYSYVLLPLDVNPLTTSAWAVADFTTLQNCIYLDS